MWTLGVNGRPVAYHDAAACLVDGDGKIVAFVEEERFTRRKHAILQSPVNATAYCLAQAGVEPEDVETIAVGWDVPRMQAGFGQQWDPASTGQLIAALLGPDVAARIRASLVFVPHHLAHAASAFYGSGFGRAAVLVIDGNGEDEAISIYGGNADGSLVRHRVWPISHSLGYVYEAATQWLGFHFLDGGKTMALAAYGRAAGVAARPLFRLECDDLVPLAGRSGGGDYEALVNGWQARFSQIAGCDAPALPAAELHHDPGAVRVAWTAQACIEAALLHLARIARQVADTPALCIAGGVALNCVANGLLEEPVYVPPVPHDAGVALGAAWCVSPPRVAGSLDPYLGPEPGPPDRSQVAGASRFPSTRIDIGDVLERLIGGQIGAVVEGRAEIGPRALGHRSIVALPSPATVRDRLNRRKAREPWRPFGPVSPASADGRYWIRQSELSRYMVGAAAMTGLGKQIAPAVCHVDGTTRPQVLRGAEAPIVAAILAELERSGLPPVLVNTSFNDRGAPIVNSADEALATFERMDLDFLILGDRLISR